MHLVNVHIIIPAFNGLKFLKKLIPVLESCVHGINHKITIVDNGSKDNILEWLITQKVGIIRNLTNLGFARANNQAARIINSRYLLLINQDTQPTPGFLHNMLALMTEGVGIVGAKMIQSGTGQLHHAGIVFIKDGADKGMPREYGRGRDPNDPGMRENMECDAVTAACMLIRTSLFLELGGFCEEYLNGWEDSDLCLRAKSLAWRIMYAANAIVWHEVESCEGRHIHEYRNRQLFKAKWVDTGIIFDLVTLRG